MSSDMPITTKEWDPGSCHRELQQNVSSLFSNCQRKGMDFKVKSEKEWKANSRTTPEFRSYGPTAPFTLHYSCPLVPEMYGEKNLNYEWQVFCGSVCTRKGETEWSSYWKREEEAMWGKRRCGGRGTFEVHKCCRKSAGDWVFNLSSCTGIKASWPVFTCRYQTCTAVHWTMLCAQEKTGEALGRDLCCGWEKTYIRRRTDPCWGFQRWVGAVGEAGCAHPAWHLPGFLLGRESGCRTLLHSCTSALVPYLAVKDVTGMWSGIIMHNAKELN